MKVFFDTSALTKRYVNEEGTAQEAFEQAIRCLEQYPLRTLDALHIGTALAYQPDLFVSADRRQVEAAKREGLAVAYLSH